ncbi:MULTISPECIES: hypothetical protein [unclassified Methylobacterium]|uniref:hypothetical protein n=1 Tax=unclassified Methylobacterium TaxID=2615210 RepID=UPI0006F9D7CE|nr:MULTISPECIES: hypothetical protein [unclassified Methylobacterium]KQP13488.1 hypothetical protein ASF26_19155 [Methylobacterium sp. Leaf93]TXN41132.1 hypothetical protein FV225_03490 [Methylobacterium sp. WL93]TXN51465.1 hypothetical protein FV227_07640 [Methylobacterium sp. WL119]TXN63800.1 hypothetical protein FV232_22410 [Methylobacterium sp. WL30]
MSESIHIAGRRIPLRRMGVREVVERMARSTELAAEFDVTCREMSPFVASLAFRRPDDAGPNRKTRRASEAKARRRA